MLVVCCAGCAALWGAWWWLGRPIAIAVPGFAPDAKLECVSYTPYEKDQSPWDFVQGAVVRRERLDVDLQLIAQQADCIRVYSVQGLGDLPAVARAQHLKILLGGWVNGDAVDTRRELTRVVALARAHPDVIRAVIVGNETLLRKEVTAAQLAEHIRWMRAQLPGVPITYADVWEFWLANPSIAPLVDFATIHVLPYWENQPMPAARAVEHLEKVLAEITHAFPQAPLMVGETGWPTEGRARQQSRANRASSAEYIQRVTTALRAKNIPYNLIEAFDQPWKRGNEGTVGGFWGLFDAARRDKGLLQSYVSNVPDWRDWAVYSIGGWLILLLLMCVAGPVRFLPHKFSGENFWGSPSTCHPPQHLSIIIFALFSVLLLTWQAREYCIAVCNDTEVVWAIVVLSVAALSILSAFGIAPRRWFSRVAQIATLGVLCVTALEMAVDARYRAFPNAAMTVAVLGWWLQARTSACWTPRDPLTWAVLLGACGIASLWDETIWNPDALWWIALLGVTMHVLCAGCPMVMWGRWFHARRRLIAVLCGAAAAAMTLRYRVMESTAVVELCATQPHAAWCGLRDLGGLLIHYRYFGTLAFVLAALAWCVPRGSARRVLTLAALIAATCGLTLYGVDRAAWGLLAAWIVVTYDDAVPRTDVRGTA